MESVSVVRMERDLRVLAQDIGVRLAGSDAERQAADYVAEQGRACGAAVSLEPFPVRERAVEREQLEILAGGRWQSFACSLFSNTPGTEGRLLEAPLCLFEAPAEYRRPDLSHLRGKAVLHLGTHIESREHYRRLMDVQPAFLLFVDIRFPGSQALADGMFPAYTRSLGAVPTVNVAYHDAWRWTVEGATAARLTVQGGMRDSASGNVVLDLPGSQAGGELVLVGGHHDTQAGSPGADDNGTGVLAIMELARLRAPLPRRRSLRLISFGAEEQLSVGSAAYVRRHRAALREGGRLMWNCDSFGSWMGWTHLVCNGSNALAAWATRRFEERDLWVQPLTPVIPYADHFPFVVAGVPSVYLGRSNCTAGRFFHHRSDDDLSRVSIPLVARLLEVSASALDEALNTPELPFPREIDPALAAPVQRFWEDLFGGWGGL